MKKSVRFLFSFLLLSVSLKLMAQTNLVLNPSFEDVNGCPAGQSLYYVDSAFNWYNPSQSTPDLFLSCTLNGEFNHVPNSAWGFQFPHNGFNYAGFAAQFYPANANGREYVGGTLADTLTSGKRYLVEMYLSLAFINSCFYKRVGVYFSDSQQEVSTIEEIQVSPQVTFDTIIRDTVNWIKVSDTLTASGGEMYFVIGLFTNNQNTVIDTFYYDTLNPGLLAYFFVDDVSVTLIEDTTVPPQPPVNTAIAINPNPSNGLISISGRIIEGSRFDVFDMSGRIVFSEMLLGGNEPINLFLPLANGLYYYQVSGDTTMYSSGKIMIAK